MLPYPLLITSPADVEDWLPATAVGDAVAGCEIAASRSYTARSDRWFQELIARNPAATVVMVGQAIAVRRPGGLLLPPGPRPDDVTLR